MPYHTVNDLPKGVLHVLPIHAQEIYIASFNHAYYEYKDKKKRRNPKEDLEKICHKVAWNAVKRKYTKDEQGSWSLKNK